MKLYHTETQEDFNALLGKLKNEGHIWFFGEVITSDDSQLWERHKQNTIVYVDVNGDGVSYGNLSYAKDKYSDTPIEKYKAKKSLDEAEELPEAIVEFLKICNEKGMAWDYTDIINYIDERQLFKYSPPDVIQPSDTSNDNRPDVITEGNLTDEAPVWYDNVVKTVKTSAENNDNVNNPDHYTSGGIETLDYIKAKVSDYPSYAVGNILDYVSRYKHKNGIEDLKKAQFYLNDLIKEMESGEDFLKEEME